jgi:hypothetical protein
VCRALVWVLSCNGFDVFCSSDRVVSKTTFLSISDKTAAERGSKEIGTFSTMRWYRQSLTITSGPKWSRKALQFAGDEIHVVDVVDSNS